MADSSLSSGFLKSSDRFPDRPALEVDGKVWTYGALLERAAGLAATLQRLDPHPEATVTAVLAHRSINAFAGILAILLRGHGYVPLNPYSPAGRTATMLMRSGCTTIVVGEEAVDALTNILLELDRRMLVVLPDAEEVGPLAARFPEHRFSCRTDLVPADDWVMAAAEETDTAYLLFTSGSTGVPKGVEVSHSSIRHFIDVMSARYEITEHDRFSQMFELVFDLSVFDMFVAWENGACLCCPSRGDARMPAKYLLDSKITVWFSVPSLALAMRQMRMLRPELYPDLRVSLFCGEALLSEVAADWSNAAPNSLVENLYGPTEVTLACTLYRWDPQSSPQECERGLVPIGYPYPGMTAIVVDEKLSVVPPGNTGELLMSGPQVAVGYWNDPQKTADSFVEVPGHRGRFYRTGDLVTSRDDGLLTYLGRMDHQVKIRGNRVELGEIEEVMRSVAGVDLAVAVGWPKLASGFDGIVVFVQGIEHDSEALEAEARERLPDYMVPREVRQIEQMPLNVNGKVDRKKLVEILETEKPTGRR